MERELKRVLHTESAQDYCQHGIALALCSEVHPRTHEAFGEGIVHRFGENLESDLEVYPDAKVVRYRNSSMAIALTNQEPPREVIESVAGDGSVLFLNHSERFHTSLLLRSDGGGMVVFAPREEGDRLNGGEADSEAARLSASTYYKPGLKKESSGSNPSPSVEPTEGSDLWPTSEQSGQEATSRIGPSPEPISPGVPESGAVSSDVPKNGETKEKQPTIRVQGNLPHHPTVTKTHHGKPLIKFSIAEHPEPGVTNYRKAYSTGRFAEKIIEQELKKGELVRVTGAEQRHPRLKNGKPVTTEDGEIVTERVIYAYGAKRVNAEAE